MSGWLKRYSIPPEKGEGWALIVLGSDGYFSTVSDWGDFTFLWRSFGKGDFRKFVIDLVKDSSYLAGKLGKNEVTFNGEETKKAIEKAISEADGIVMEAEIAHLDGFSMSDISEFWVWSSRSELKETHELIVNDHSNTATAFCKHIMPRLKKLLEEELENEKNATPPALQEGYTKNFNTLKEAVDDGNIALLSCLDKQTKQPVAVICAVNEPKHKGGEIELVPLAKMFDGNPYDEVEPPTP